MDGLIAVSSSIGGARTDGPSRLYDSPYHALVPSVPDTTQLENRYCDRVRDGIRVARLGAAVARFELRTAGMRASAVQHRY